MPHIAGHRTNGRMQQCIDNCLNCHRVCLETVAYCLNMGHEHAQADHITLLLDCAEICQTSANFMLRSSEFLSRTCAVCAEICERCAESCERWGDDQQMHHCAQECRRCADSCREMAA